jgi:hypothetical protein
VTVAPTDSLGGFDPASPEGEFLAELNLRGIRYSSPDAAVTLGQSLCHALDDGEPLSNVNQVVTGASHVYTQAQVGVIVDAAIGALCPAHQDLLQAPAPAPPSLAASAGTGGRSSGGSVYIPYIPYIPYVPHLHIRACVGGRHLHVCI